MREVAFFQIVQARGSQGRQIHSGIMKSLQRIISQYFVKHQLMQFHRLFAFIYIYGWGEGGQERAQGVSKEGGSKEV